MSEFNPILFVFSMPHHMIDAAIAQPTVGSIVAAALCAFGLWGAPIFAVAGTLFSILNNQRIDRQYR